MKRTVAIVGFSNLTMPYVVDSKADEFWTVNHAYVMGEKIPRIDRLFEMHHKDWFLRKELASGEAYWRWLTQATCPIVMQEIDPDIPSSVRYPYDEVVEDLFGSLRRGDELNPYFTSSFSFMLALAIYERWDRVEIYGIEMLSDTEYGYQRFGAEFMIGLAAGRGIEVVLHPKSELCKAHIYGYDGVPNIPRPRTEQLLGLYHDRGIQYTEQMNALVAQYNGGDAAVRDKVMECSALASMHEGALQVLNRLMNESDYYLGRQNLEKQRRSYHEHMEYHKAVTNEKHSAFMVTQDPNVWQEYLDSRSTMYANSGAVQVIDKLIDECDLKIVAPDLILTIKDV